MESVSSYQFIMPDSAQYSCTTDGQYIATVNLEEILKQDVKEETKTYRKFKKTTKLKKPNQERRSCFSKDQLSVLEATYYANKYITLEQRKELSQRIGLTETQVQHWFQKHRYNEKKKMKQQQTLEKQWNQYLLDLIAGSTDKSFLELLEYTDNYCNQRDRLIKSAGVEVSDVCPHAHYHGTVLKCPCAPNATTCGN